MNPNNPTTAPFSRRLDEEETVGEWLALHKTALGWGVLAIVIALGGARFYQRSQTLKSERAEKAYYQARGAAAAGNSALAIADLRKMADRYAGTRAGTQGRMYLAQMYFDQRKFKEGLAELQVAEKSLGSKADFGPSVHVLEANAYEELKDFVSAADHYRQAAEASRFPNDKNQFRAYQARALTVAGKRAEALAIWRDLAKDDASPFAVEARLRIGELEAGPAKV